MKMKLQPKKMTMPVSGKTVEKGVQGDLDTIAKENMGEKLKKIKEFEDKLKERWAFEGDSEFYFSICFKSGLDRDKFLFDNKVELQDGKFVFYEDLPKTIITGGE